MESNVRLFNAELIARCHSDMFASKLLKKASINIASSKCTNRLNNLRNTLKAIDLIALSVPKCKHLFAIFAFE